MSIPATTIKAVMETIDGSHKSTDTVLRLPPSPAARFIEGASVLAACSAESPARAKFRDASAASDMPKVELEAASDMALFKSFACFSEFPIVSLTSVIVLSTSAYLLTATVAPAAMGTVTFLVRPRPTFVTVVPTASSFLPASPIFVRAVFA